MGARDDLWWVETKGVEETPHERKLSIRQVKAQVSIERVLRHYGLDVQPGDHDWVSVRCPFHADSSPSASVNHRLGRFRCHVCDMGGDIVDVVSSAEDLNAKEALEWIRQTLL